MSLVNRIIVTCRLESGDSIDVSAKTTSPGYSQNDVKKLRAKIVKQLEPVVDDTLYYQVRTWAGENGKERRNWSRLPDLESLYKVIEEVMVMKGEATAS